MRKILLFCLLTASVAGAYAQRSDRSFVRKGNRMFEDSLFIKAEENYLKAPAATTSSLQMKTA